MRQSIPESELYLKLKLELYKSSRKTMHLWLWRVSCMISFAHIRISVCMYNATNTVQCD